MAETVAYALENQVCINEACQTFAHNFIETSNLLNQPKIVKIWSRGRKNQGCMLACIPACMHVVCMSEICYICHGWVGLDWFGWFGC